MCSAKEFILEQIKLIFICLQKFYMKTGFKREAQGNLEVACLTF